MLFDGGTATSATIGPDAARTRRTVASTDVT
jgi:hypothetical protein